MFHPVSLDYDVVLDTPAIGNILSASTLCSPVRILFAPLRLSRILLNPNEYNPNRLNLSSFFSLAIPGISLGNLLCALEQEYASTDKETKTATIFQL